MSTHRPIDPDLGFDTAARDWIAVGPQLAPHRALAAAFDQIATIDPPRRRSWRRVLEPAWRLATAGGFLAIAVVSILILPQLHGTIGGPGASPSATVSAVPTADPPLLGTAGWQTFTSGQYRYALRMPADWGGASGTTPWSLERFSSRFLADYGEDVMAPGREPGYPRLHAWSIIGEPGMDLAAYIAALTEAGGIYLSCPETPEAWTAVTIDGSPARIVRSTCNAAWALAAVEAGGWFYTFHVEDRVGWPDSSVFRTILSTIDLRPDDAVPAASPGSAPAAS